MPDESTDEEHLFIGLGWTRTTGCSVRKSGAWKIACTVLCCSVRVSGWGAALSMIWWTVRVGLTRLP